MDTHSFSNLVGLLYSAVEDAGAWERFVVGLSSILHADSALFFTPMNDPDDGGLVVRVNSDESPLRAYRDHYRNHDLWYAGAKARRLDGAGLVVLGEELVDEAQFQRSEWLNDFLRPSKQVRLLGANVNSGPDVRMPAFLNFYKSHEDEVFSDQDRAAVLLLLPHIQKAFRMRTNHVFGARRAAFLEGTLQAQSTPYMVLDRDLRLAMCNAAALRILDMKDGLCLSAEDRICCGGHPGQGRLSDFILRSLSAGPPPGSHDGGLLIDRPSGEGVLLLQAAAMETPSCRRKHALVSLTLLGTGRQRICTTGLRQLGLSESEARLAAIVGSGTAPADAAEELGISEGNARTALKRIFSKLAINRQSELAVIVTRIGHGQVAP